MSRQKAIQIYLDQNLFKFLKQLNLKSYKNLDAIDCNR